MSMSTAARRTTAGILAAGTLSLAGSALAAGVASAADTAVTPAAPTTFNCTTLQVETPKTEGVTYTYQYGDSPTDKEKAAGVSTALVVKALPKSGYSIAAGAKDTFRLDFSGGAAKLCAGDAKTVTLKALDAKPAAAATETPKGDPKTAKPVKPTELDCFTGGYKAPGGVEGVTYSYMAPVTPTDAEKAAGAKTVGEITAKPAAGYVFADKKDSVSWRYNMDVDLKTACKDGGTIALKDSTAKVEDTKATPSKDAANGQSAAKPEAKPANNGPLGFLIKPLEWIVGGFTKVVTAVASPLIAGANAVADALNPVIDTVSNTLSPVKSTVTDAQSAIIRVDDQVKALENQVNSTVAPFMQIVNLLNKFASMFGFRLF